MSKKSYRFAITTLGCKVNQCDSAAIVHQMQERGLCHVPFADEADCYIINTCVVTSSTEAQSRQLIRRALGRSEEAVVVVTGCYAQKNADKLMAMSPRVKVAGNREKKDLPHLIERFLLGCNADFTVQDIALERLFSTPFADTFAGRTRASLKIQDGCNGRCAYCIVPSVRGPSRSLPSDQVMERMHALTANGFREIVLTGIHLGAWGLDLTPRMALSDIVEMCVRDPLLQSTRIRLSSIEPTEWCDDIIHLLAGSETLCHHVHIPVQSGDPELLKSMQRSYTPDFFHELVMRLIQEIPDLNIGIDVITGLPGETDERFETTLSFLESLPAGYLHVFPYSRRPGTPAAVMPGQVVPAVIRERMQILRQLSDRKKQAFYKRFAGTVMEVLVEGRREKSTGLLRGITGNYIPVLFRGDDSLMGTLQRVRLVRLDGGVMRGFYPAGTSNPSHGSDSGPRQY